MDTGSTKWIIPCKAFKTVTGKIQHTIDAFHKRVQSACQVPAIVLDTSKNLTNT